MIPVSVMAVMPLVIAVSFLFALSNGLHDASSVVATVITSGAATPRVAVLLASVFGLTGVVLGGNAVAGTVSSVVDLPSSGPLLTVLLSAVTGAVLWNVITWKLGMPSSSTHALMGALVGAVLVSSGGGHVLWGWRALVSATHRLEGVAKIVLSLLISPAAGFLAALLLEKLTKVLLRNARFAINKTIKRLQLLVAAALAFSHGANDSQKILGVVALSIVSAQTAPLQQAPVWARLCLGAVMFLGTLLGGWKIMRTVGRGIFELQPIHSLNAQLASAGSLLAANFTGAPVSSTHIVVGSVMGVGSAENYRMVNWGIVRGILLSWVITIPASGALSALLYLLIGRLVKPV